MVDPFNLTVHRCAAMRALVSQARQVACDEGNVLIEGEFGTGKELLARAIHATSARNTKPFIVINCGSIPELLLESELFGHQQGGFTPSAHRVRPGWLERASGGTVFLDDILELPASMQAKILETLETRTAIPVGSRTRHPIDVRVISASTKRLDISVGVGQFNRSLRDRLADHFLWMPPLRERVGDIEILVDHFLSNPPEWLAPHVHKVLAPGGMDRLLAHRWPGNVRELHNVLEGAFVRAEGRTVIEVKDFQLPLESG